MPTSRFSLGDAFFIDAANNIGINLGTAPLAKFHMSGSTATAASYAMLVYNGAGTNAFTIRDDGNVGVGTTAPGQKFTVAGIAAPSADNTYTLGTSGARWSTVYGLNLVGSLTTISDGTSYLVAGTNVTIVTQSNGSVRISATGGGGGGSGDTLASYVVLTSTGSLANERVLTAGSGTLLTDMGAGSSVFISTVTSPLVTMQTASTHFLSPSRDQMAVHAGTSTGTFYLPTSANTGDTVTIQRGWGAGPIRIYTTGSFTIHGVASEFNLNTDHTVPGTAGNGYLQTLKFRASGSSWNFDGYFDLGTTYRSAAYIHGKPITLNSGDPSLNNVLLYNGNAWVPHTPTYGDTFPSYVVMAATASLPNERVLTAGNNILITDSGAGNPVTISGRVTGDAAASYLVLSTTASLPNANQFNANTAGSGLRGSSAGSNYTLTINNNIVATVSGSTFTGATIHSAGLSGSLTRLTSGASYLAAGTGIQITTSSLGQVVITSTGGGGPTVTRLTGSATISAARTNVVIVRQPASFPTVFVTLAHLSSSWQDGDLVEVKLRGNTAGGTCYVSSSNKFDGSSTLYGPLADGESISLRADLTYGEWIIV